MNFDTSTHSEYQIVETHDWVNDIDRVTVYTVTETRTTVQPRLLGLINDTTTDQSVYNVVRSREFGLLGYDRIVYLESGLDVPDNLRVMIRHLEFKQEVLAHMDIEGERIERAEDEPPHAY